MVRALRSEIWREHEIEKVFVRMELSQIKLFLCKYF